MKTAVELDAGRAHIERRSMEVDAFRDTGVDPCCALDFEKGLICPFYRADTFGLTETCVFAVQADRRQSPLQRRQSSKGKDFGSLIPMETCPVWTTGKPVKGGRSGRPRGTSPEAVIKGTLDSRPVKASNQILNVHEAADFLRIASRTLRNLVAQRELQVVRIGGRVLFRQKDLDAFVESRLE